MPISVSTCITNTGTQPLSSTLQIYSNPVSLYNQGTFVQNVPSSSITGANCPYTFTVPNGTVNVRILDPTTLCYVDLPVSSTDVCTTCSLQLNNVNNNLLGQINVGTLVGTCDNSISDYVMTWYGPNSTSNLSFTSGQGTAFAGQYLYTHPITSTNSPVLNPGTYVGKITKVDLNGAKFSSVAGTGLILSPTLTDCTTTVNVQTYNCTNGSTVDTYYKHLRSFNYNGTLPPAILTTTLQLNDPTQKDYVIFSFQGNTIPDTIKFTLFGSAYPNNPIQLEECTVGSTSDNFTPTTWPKGVNTTSSFKKILNLTGLNINVGDTIQIKISPNTSTNETNWRLVFGCSTQPTGNKNCLDTYKNSPYKIKTSTLLPTYDNTSCPPTYKVSFSVVGCTQATNNTEWFNSSLFNLVKTYVSQNENFGSSGSDGLIPLTYSFKNSYSKIENYSLSVTNAGNCISSVGIDYRVEKSITPNPSLTFYFRNVTDLNNMITNIQTNFNDVKNYNSSGLQPGPYSTTNSNINYYRYVRFRIQANSICGDGANYQYIYYPLNSTIQSGPLPTPYLIVYTHFIKITPQVLAYNLLVCPAGYCDCSLAQSVVTQVNNSVQLNPFTYTLTKYQTSPIDYAIFCEKNNAGGTFEESRTGFYQFNFPYGDRTYPAQGGPNYNSSLLPSLPNGSTTWDWQNHWAIDSTYFSQRVFYYTVKAKTPLTNPVGYEIWGYTISNFGLGTYFKIYDTATGGIVPGKESFFV